MVEALAFDMLHGEKLGTSALFDRVDGDDVGVIQRRGGLRFLDEAAPAFRICDLLGWEFEQAHVEIGQNQQLTNRIKQRLWPDGNLAV